MFLKIGLGGSCIYDRWVTATQRLLLMYLQGRDCLPGKGWNALGCLSHLKSFLDAVPCQPSLLSGKWAV